MRSPEADVASPRLVGRRLLLFWASSFAFSAAPFAGFLLLNPSETAAFGSCAIANAPSPGALSHPFNVTPHLEHTPRNASLAPADSGFPVRSSMNDTISLDGPGRSNASTSDQPVRWLEVAF